MPAKKIADTPKESETKEASKKSKARFFQGLGRRKTAIARVRVYKSKEKIASPEDIMVNSLPFNKFFTVSELCDIVQSPMELLAIRGTVNVEARIKGGGIRGQAEALRLGISRALLVYDETYRKTLRDAGFLTRDARIVERKKAGLKKARRAPQFSKR